MCRFGDVQAVALRKQVQQDAAKLTASKMRANAMPEGPEKDAMLAEVGVRGHRVLGEG